MASRGEVQLDKFSIGLGLAWVKRTDICIKNRASVVS